MEFPDQLCNRILRTLWRHAPVNATYLGIHDYDYHLSAFHPDTLDSQAAELKTHLAEIRTSREALPEMTGDQRLDLDLLEGELKTQLRSMQEMRSPFRNPGAYLEEASFGVYILMVREFAPPEERARGVLSRLREVPRILSEARQNLRQPEEVPLLWSEMACDLGATLCEFLSEATLWAARCAPALAEDVKKAARSAREEVQSYLRFLEERVHPRARGSFATGSDFFEFLLREAHGLSDTASDLEAFGQQEICETQRQLQAMAEDQAAGGWEARVEEFKRDVPREEGLLSAYRDEIDRSRRFVLERGLLELPAGERLEVVETPVFERKTTPFAAYVPAAPFEELQKGYFWVTPPEGIVSEEERRQHMKEHMLAAIPITCVHEGYPGHHAQLSLANRAGSPVQRQIGTPVLIEGWALYCEEMMGEQGFYSDPRTRLLQLKDYLWRCSRVVIDVGLHTGHLTFEEAVQILVRVAKINPVSARGEVKRYSKTPTQPLSYAVGKRELTRLRDDVRRLEGDRFSLKEFHRRLLRHGSIAPQRIREQIFPAPQA
ncbi:MAG: DUF885 domain-containing protein [Acidobacteria bacterium]|nr:DUF885 domain-containing protein [Acidobacteriota bacterium]